MSRRRKPNSHRPGGTRRFTQVRLVDSIAGELQRMSRYRCPDCNAELGTLTILGTRVAYAEIRHDNTCPWLAQAAGS